MDVETTIREHILKIIHLSLATVANDKPWVSEVHFAYDDNLNLYFRSLRSRRHSQEIELNPVVAGNIVRQFGLKEAPVGVYFEGTAKLLEPGEERDVAFNCIKERLGAGDEIIEEAKLPDGHQFYKISVDTYYLFGRFDGDVSRKYELKWNGGSK